MRLDPRHALPRTMQAYEQTESLHRWANPIGGKLSAKIRGTVSESLHCEALRRMTLEDLRHFDSDSATDSDVGEELSQVTQIEHSIRAFARKLTLAGYRITDEEVASLVGQIGVKELIGVVHTIAFANFQARLFLAMGDESDLDETQRPHEVDAAREAFQGASKSMRAREFPEVPDEFLDRMQAPSTWGELDFAHIESAMLRQQERSCRVPIPADEQLAHLTDVQRQRSAEVIWSRISLVYQPEMTSSWFQLLDVFQAESQLDQVFCNSLFLVVTRGNQCFY